MVILKGWNYPHFDQHRAVGLERTVIGAQGQRGAIIAPSGQMTGGRAESVGGRD